MVLIGPAVVSHQCVCTSLGINNIINENDKRFGRFFAFSTKDPVGFGRVSSSKPKPHKKTRLKTKKLGWCWSFFARKPGKKTLFFGREKPGGGEMTFGFRFTTLALTVILIVLYEVRLKQENKRSEPKTHQFRFKKGNSADYRTPLLTASSMIYIRYVNK